MCSFSYEYLYLPKKYGRRVNNTNTIKPTQLQIRQHLKLDSNLDTRLTHNTLGMVYALYIQLYHAYDIYYLHYLGRIAYTRPITTPCFRKKTSTHIIGYKLRNNCLILMIFDTNILHIILHRMID